MTISADPALKAQTRRHKPCALEFAVHPCDQLHGLENRSGICQRRPKSLNRRSVSWFIPDRRKANEDRMSVSLAEFRGPRPPFRIPRLAWSPASQVLFTFAQGILAGALHGLPRAPRPRGTRMRRQRVLEATLKKDHASPGRRSAGARGRIPPAPCRRRRFRCRARCRANGAAAAVRDGSWQAVQRAARDALDKLRYGEAATTDWTRRDDSTR